MFFTYSYSMELISIKIGTRVLFSPEKFVIRAGRTKRRMKLKIEGTTTLFYGEKKVTLENLRKILDTSTSVANWVLF